MRGEKENRPRPISPSHHTERAILPHFRAISRLIHVADEGGSRQTASSCTTALAESIPGQKTRSEQVIEQMAGRRGQNRSTCRTGLLGGTHQNTKRSVRVQRKRSGLSPDVALDDATSWNTKNLGSLTIGTAKNARIERLDCNRN